MIVAKKIKKGGLLMSIPRDKALTVHEGAPSPLPWLLPDDEWSLVSE